jgi:hypothetical protein
MIEFYQKRKSSKRIKTADCIGSSSYWVTLLNLRVKVKLCKVPGVPMLHALPNLSGAVMHPARSCLCCLHVNHQQCS